MINNVIMVNRIKQRMNEVGLNAKQLAEKAHVGKSFVYDILNGKSKNPTSNKLISISKHLGIPLSYLVDIEDSSVDMKHYVSIRSLHEEHSSDGKPPLLLRTSFFKNSASNNTYHSSDINDDSMEPTFYSGDIVIVDTAKKRYGSSGLFLIKDSISITVRRIEHIMGSTKIRVIADNPKYGTYEQELNKVILLGKVVWYLRSI